MRSAPGDLEMAMMEILAGLRLLLSTGLNPIAVVGMVVVVYLLQQGLGTVKTYVSGKEIEKNQLLEFIKVTQARQDARENGFLESLSAINERLAGIDLKVVEHVKKSDDHNIEVRDSLRKLNDDVLKAKA